MKIALQVGLAWLMGLLVFAGIGWLGLLAFAIGSVKLFLLISVPVVGAFVCLGLAVYDVAWYWRVLWGLAVGAGGIVGTVFVLPLGEEIEPKWIAWPLAGLSHAVIAALFARNPWVRGAGAVVLAAVLVLAPASTWEAFSANWARLA